MNRLFTLAVAAALAISLSTAAWSQQAQTGQAGAAGTAGTAGAAGQAGTPSQAGTTSTTGQAGAAGLPGATATSAAAQSAIPGQSGASSNFDPAAQRQGQFAPGGQPAQGVPIQNFNNRSLSTFGPIRRVPFFADPLVRQQLQLSPGHFDQLNRAHLDALANFNRSVSNLNQNLVEQQRLQQMQAFEREFNQQFGRAVDTTILDPRLRQRFDQLSRQSLGLNAINDPAVTGSLNLTPAQQQRLRLMANQWNQQMRQLSRRNDNDPRLDDEFQELQLEARELIESVLTPQQLQIWPQLVGPFFNFPPSAFRQPEDVAMREQIDNQAAPPQPGVPQPGAPQPGVPQPNAPQPGVPLPGAPQPGVPQPGAPQPGVGTDGGAGAGVGADSGT